MAAASEEAAGVRSFKLHLRNGSVSKQDKLKVVFSLLCPLKAIIYLFKKCGGTDVGLSVPPARLVLVYKREDVRYSITAIHLRVVLNYKEFTSNRQLPVTLTVSLSPCQSYSLPFCIR